MASSIKKPSPAAAVGRVRSVKASRAICVKVADYETVRFESEVVLDVSEGVDFAEAHAAASSLVMTALRDELLAFNEAVGIHPRSRFVKLLQGK